MAHTSLQPASLILANLYVIMLLQLVFNWAQSDCGTQSNLFQLAFILILVARLFILQTYNNSIVKRMTFMVLLFLTTALLFSLAIYESVIIANNSSQFQYDAKTKVGNETCFQNRIIFVAQIIISFLTSFKDIYFVLTNGYAPETKIED